MLTKLLAVVLPLGLDTFVVTAALGLAGLTARQRARVTALIVLMETGMPLIGLGLGIPLRDAIGCLATYLATGLLVSLGLYTLLWEDSEEGWIERFSGLTGPRTVLLGLSVSLDELTIGLSLGLLGLPVVLTVALIAFQALLVTQAGLHLGHRLSEHIRERAERIAGAALLVLGIVLLTETITQ